MTTFVIATKDLIKAGRGIDRLYWQCLSLTRQSERVDIVLVDGSGYPEFNLISKRLKGLPVRLFHQPQATMNLPKLWNFGIQQAHEWVHISGADFLYSPTFMNVVKEVRATDRLVMCKVWDAPKGAVNRKAVEEWKWPKLTEFFPLNPKLANGIQHAKKELFLDVPYDERMEKLGGMDNLQQYKCEREGYECFWWEQQHVLHQWHKMSPMKIDPQFNRNQQTIKDYLS